MIVFVIAAVVNLNYITYSFIVLKWCEKYVSWYATCCATKIEDCIVQDHMVWKRSDKYLCKFCDIVVAANISHPGRKPFFHRVRCVVVTGVHAGTERPLWRYSQGWWAKYVSLCINSFFICHCAKDFCNLRDLPSAHPWWWRQKLPFEQNMTEY